MIQETIDKVVQWGFEKGILGPHGGGTVEGQLKKFHEEAGEVIESVSRYLGCKETFEIMGGPCSLPRANKETKDAIGDTLVTLILLARMLDTDLDECLNAAYDVISKRTGTMKNGVFVKDK